jgi:hypothetical protein
MDNSVCTRTAGFLGVTKALLNYLKTTGSPASHTRTDPAANGILRPIEGHLQQIRGFWRGTVAPK